MRNSKSFPAGSIVREFCEVFEGIVENVDVPMKTKRGGSVRMTLAEIVERQDKAKRQVERKAKRQADKIREEADKAARLDIYSEFGDDIDDGLGLPYDDVDIDERKLNNARILFLRSLVR